MHVADPAAAIESPTAAGNAAADAASDSASAVAGATEDGEAEAGGLQPARPTQPAAPASAPVVDQSRLWEQIAAAAFAADGSMDGWDSDSERQETKESKEQAYIKVCGRSAACCCQACAQCLACALFLLCDVRCAAAHACASSWGAPACANASDPGCSLPCNALPNLQAHPDVPVVENLWGVFLLLPYWVLTHLFRVCGLT